MHDEDLLPRPDVGSIGWELILGVGLEWLFLEFCRESRSIGEVELSTFISSIWDLFGVIIVAVGMSFVGVVSYTT